MKKLLTPTTRLRVPSILFCTLMAGISAAHADNTSKFESADIDNSGTLDLHEFATTLNDHAPAKQVSKKFNRADANDDELVSLEEWLDYKSDIGEEGEVEKHTARFEDTDADANGFVSYDEFVASSPGKKPLIQVRKKFLKIDADEDMQLSLAEWLAAEDEGFDDNGKNPRKFALADLDENGELTLEEFAGVYPRKTKMKPILKKFEKLDDNDDGILTRDEWNPGNGKKDDKKGTKAL